MAEPKFESISPGAAKPRAADRDAIALLRADHRTIATLFADLERAAALRDKLLVPDAAAGHVSVMDLMAIGDLMVARKAELLAARG